MKKTIEVNYRRGAFWVRDGSMRETPIGPGEPEGTCYQVIDPQVIDVMRSGRGYQGLELDVARDLNEKAEEMRSLLVAQGHDVGVLFIT